MRHATIVAVGAAEAHARCVVHRIRRHAKQQVAQHARVSHTVPPRREVRRQLTPPQVARNLQIVLVVQLQVAQLICRATGAEIDHKLSRAGPAVVLAHAPQQPVGRVEGRATNRRQPRASPWARRDALAVSSTRAVRVGTAATGADSLSRFATFVLMSAAAAEEDALFFSRLIKIEIGSKGYVSNSGRCIYSVARCRQKSRRMPLRDPGRGMRNGDVSLWWALGDLS